MTKLEKLYELASGVKEFDLKSKEAILQEINELEEDIIRKEILPIVKDRIEPALSQVQRELVLVVDYSPNAPLKVKLSRRAKLEKFEDLVDLTPDPQATHTTHAISQPPKSRAKASKLIVYLPDGKVIQEDSAAATLVEAVKKANPVKVRTLGIICCKVPLVSTTKDKKYGPAQVEIAKGLYIITHSNNDMKKGYLERISKELNLGWKVELLK